MKTIQYLCTILFLQNSLCTIDISIPEYQHLSRHLTPEECRRLYASLHFMTFDLPDLLTAEKNIPLNVPCIKLLIKWDTGSEKWEGRDKSHVDVARRLRQIGREDLAEWLSQTVFTRLVAEVGDALNAKFINKTNVVEKKSPKHKKELDNNWTLYDSIMWAVLAGLVISTSVIIGKIIIICCKRRVQKKRAREEEIMELLSYRSMDSDQETIYECDVNRFGGKDKSNVD